MVCSVAVTHTHTHTAAETPTSADLTGGGLSRVQMAVLTVAVMAFVALLAGLLICNKCRTGKWKLHFDVKLRNQKSHFIMK